MWASNTLVAYPEVQSAGLQSTRSVGAAVSAGVVADLLSLTVLAFATSTVVIEIDPESFPFGGRFAEIIAPEAVEPSTPDPALPLWGGLPFLAGVCLWLLPRIGRWFFVRVGRTRPQRVVFAFCLMGLGSVVALLAGMEGLVGAFLSGLGLNRMIPTNGPLMDRLDFVGNTIFVPVFLVSIGISIDPALLVDGATIRLGLLFTAFVLVGKTAAAVITSLATRWFARRVAPPDVSHCPVAEELLVDSRARGSDVDQLARLVTRLVHADGGVDAARIEVDRIVDAIAARGHDADGLTRADDSFVAATISMAAETDATGIVLDWAGPNWVNGDESLTIISGDDAGEEVLSGIVADDLVVAPAHLVRSAIPSRTRPLARALQTANAVVVGGPHRLSLLRSSPRRGLSAAIRPVPEA